MENKKENKEKDNKSNDRFMYENDMGLSVASKAEHVNKEESDNKEDSKAEKE